MVVGILLARMAIWPMNENSTQSGSLNRTGWGGSEVQFEPATQVKKSWIWAKHMGAKYFQESDQRIWVKNIFRNLTPNMGEKYFQESDQRIWVKNIFRNLIKKYMTCLELVGTLVQNIFRILTPKYGKATPSTCYRRWTVFLE